MDAAFIGLGQMGQVMAMRAIAAGHGLAVFNRSLHKARPLAEAGATIATSISDAASHGGVAITMLANDAAVRAVALDSGGLVASLPPGGIHLAMGTHSVATARALAGAHRAAGQFFVCAPVLGRPETVTAGRLGIIVAGPGEAIDRCRPLLLSIGNRLFEAGEEPGASAAIKIANNFLLGCAIEALGEAFSLTEKLGVAPALFYDVVTDGLFASPAYATYGKLIAEKTYAQPGFTAWLGLKDANLALSAGEEVGVPLPSASVWRDHLLSAVAHGEGDCDWAVMALQQARASGLR